MESAVCAVFCGYGLGVRGYGVGGGVVGKWLSMLLSSNDNP